MKTARWRQRRFVRDSKQIPANAYGKPEEGAGLFAPASNWQGKFHHAGITHRLAPALPAIAGVVIDPPASLSLFRNGTWEFLARLFKPL
ncbi:MAG: hypothetical protein ACR652_11665 [Methylocystis sp.]|uniref:hypothetical protein n=1 Tax=Methylocystis sp. TaxID=1911079 RepID=UPI003DA26360